MNNDEALECLAGELKNFRQLPYSKLQKLIEKEPHTMTKVGKDGVKYQIEIMCFWDDKPKGNIRVMGAVDDTGWRAFFPLSSSFIKSPDDGFVDE